jgi:hypothetical protein
MKPAKHIASLVPALLVLALVPARAGAVKWAGGILLLPSVGARVDGEVHAGGPLAGTEEVSAAHAEVRLFARGPAGKALAVLAPGSGVSLSGGAAEGWVLDLDDGAVRVVRTAGQTPPLHVTVAGQAVGLPDRGGVVALTAEGHEVLELGSSAAEVLFPGDAPAAARSLSLPSTGLPLLENDEEELAAAGGAGPGSGTEVEGESKCLDTAEMGPEGTDPTSDGNTGVEIDRTKTRINLEVTW